MNRLRFALSTALMGPATVLTIAAIVFGIAAHAVLPREVR